MTDEQILQALRRLRAETGSLVCIGCGWEHNCGTHGCAILRQAADLIERLTAENAALREKQRWIPVTERLPEPETDVLAVCNRNGYIFVIPAIYEDGKMLTEDSAWSWSDIYCYGLYDEEADDYYIPEGWWENRKFNPDDVYNNPVDCAVTHWMPLLEAPEKGEKAWKLF